MSSSRWDRTVNPNKAVLACRACGFVEEGRQRSQVWSDGRHIDLVLMGVLRDEWKSLYEQEQ
ncbi:MAG TPA: GNAT family protein [Ktedonobacteraceae bacterium]